MRKSKEDRIATVLGIAALMVFSVGNLFPLSIAFGVLSIKDKEYEEGVSHFVVGFLSLFVFKEMSFYYVIGEVLMQNASAVLALAVVVFTLFSLSYTLYYYVSKLWKNFTK